MLQRDGRIVTQLTGCRKAWNPPTASSLPDEDWRMAWEAYGRGEADAAGLWITSPLSSCGGSASLTNDRYFRAAGFEVLF